MAAPSFPPQYPPTLDLIVAPLGELWMVHTGDGVPLFEALDQQGATDWATRTAEEFGLQVTGP